MCVIFFASCSFYFAFARFFTTGYKSGDARGVLHGKHCHWLKPSLGYPCEKRRSKMCPLYYIEVCWRKCGVVVHSPFRAGLEKV